MNAINMLRHPVVQLAYRPARTSELATLRRLSPDADPFDRTLIAEGRIRVLTRDGQPVGAIGWVEAGAGRAALRSWLVLGSDRGVGFGRHLMDAALAELRGAGLRWVDLDAPTALVPLLTRWGFRAFGPAPFFVDGRPLTGVWMTRLLAATAPQAVV